MPINANEVRLTPMGWLTLRNLVEGNTYTSTRGLTDARRAGLVEPDSRTVTDLGRQYYAIAMGQSV